MKIIDPHLHLFNLEQGDYHWLKKDNPPFWPDKNIINRSFTEQELKLTQPFELAGFVHIEAGFDNKKPCREIAWLESSCKLPFKSIANIDITLSSDNFSLKIEKLTRFSSMVGIRHILDDKAFSLLSDKQVISNIAKLNSLGLLFEVQMSLLDHQSINLLCDVIKHNNNMSFIINHTGFPPIDTQTIEWKHWQSNLIKLSIFSHVAIKLSGWEMMDRNYTQSKSQSWLNLMMQGCFDIFGIKRVMLASNFPLCLFSQKNYQQYWLYLLSTDFFQTKTEQEKSALLYNNALQWYQLNNIL